MDKFYRRKKAIEYYRDNKDSINCFIQNVFDNEGPITNNLYFKIRRITSPYSGYFRFPDKIVICIYEIIDTALKFPSSIITEYIKFSILYTIIHEKYHSIQYHPIRFRDVRKTKGKVYNYFESPTHKMTYNYIMNNIDKLSYKYSIGRDILSNFTIKKSYTDFLKNKKFKKCSEYNTFKNLYYNHNIDFNDLEKTCIGDNYYNSEIYLIINSGVILIKKGNEWFYENMYSFYKDKSIIIEYH